MSAGNQVARVGGTPWQSVQLPGGAAPAVKSWASLFQKSAQASAAPMTPLAAVAKDESQKNVYGDILRIYKLEQHRGDLLHRGITNRGNLCYVNATLQALLACPPFTNLLQALSHVHQSGGSSDTPVLDSMVALSKEMVGSAQSRASSPIDGSASLRVLRSLRSFVDHNGGRQGDAEEFLGCLLNTLDEEMLKLLETTPPREEKHSLVAEIFRGRTNLRLRRECPRPQPRPRNRQRQRQCQPKLDVVVTDTQQPFYTLQLDIEFDLVDPEINAFNLRNKLFSYMRANSVQEALRLYAEGSAMDGVPGTWHQSTLEELPGVLVMQLICFRSAAGGTTEKIIKNLNLALDLQIDSTVLSKNCAQSSSQRQYELVAVVAHEGFKATSGHYVAYANHGQAGWFRFDDARVTQVTTAQVLRPSQSRMPYLLMYRRRTP